MEREEAIKYLEDALQNNNHQPSYIGVDWGEVYRLSIEALKEKKEVNYGMQKCR